MKNQKPDRKPIRVITGILFAFWLCLLVIMISAYFDPSISEEILVRDSKGFGFTVFIHIIILVALFDTMRGNKIFKWNLGATQK